MMLDASIAFVLGERYIFLGIGVYACMVQQLYHKDL